MARKITLFFLTVTILLSTIWYSSFDADSSLLGLGSSVLTAEDVSCGDVPAKIQEVTIEKNVIHTQLEQIRTELRSLSGKKSELDISQKQIEEEKSRLTNFENDFFKETQFENADELRTSIQKIALNAVDLKQRVANSTNFIKNRLLNRKIRILENRQEKNSVLLSEYTSALNTENARIENKQDENSTETKNLIQQIAQKENSRKNYEDALQQLENFQTQLNTKNITCSETVAQNTVSNDAENVTTVTNTNSNNTVEDIQTTAVVAERENTVTETVNTASVDMARSNTETVASTGGETVTANATTTTTQSASVEQVAQQTVTNQNTVTTSNTTTATNTTTNTVSNTNTTTTNNTPASASTNTNTAANITVVPVVEQTLSASSGTSGQNTSIESGAIKQDIFMNVSGLPGFTEFSEARNPLKSLMVSNSSNKLINVTGGQVCWFSAKQIGNIQNLFFWTQQSWEGYKSIFLDQIYFYFDKKPASNYEEPFSITTYIGKCIDPNNKISHNCWIESSNVATRSAEDRKYQASTSNIPFPSSWTGKQSLYFSYHANFSGIRTLSTGGTSFDRDFIFYGCVDKNEPIPKF